jgi:hypothetical protein
MFQQMNLSLVGHATADTVNPCKSATVPNMIGKTVKEVVRSTAHISGKRDYTAITIVFTDGTRVLGAGFQASASPPITTDGAFVIVSDKGCPFVIR